MTTTLTYDQPTLDLYLAHRGALIDYAQPIVGCRARAEDVVQEAYLRFAQVNQERADRQRAAPEQIRHPAGYLYRIVRNLALDWARHRALEGEAPAPEQLDHLPAAAPTPEQAVVDRDQVRRLLVALQELPARTRLAFEMHRLEGRTFPEIARHLDVSVGFAHRLVKQALTHCANRLDEPGRLEALEP
ncbi:MAG TPA: sigma-70 family RNA polymerase sigma factor [Dongiaceae bacterium]|nr:sigma-70 family RNA polymerase sigma factor [Dongiaceae bacterium]